MATSIPVSIPPMYNKIITSAAYFLKNNDVKSTYIGSFAEQLINGVRRIVIFLSRSDDNVLDDITPGTVHPKPMSIGTILRPESPILRSILSITKATLAM